MRARNRIGFVFAALALLGAPIVAHHSFATYYLEEDTIEVEGDIVEFQYRNPHSWIHVEGEERANRGVRIYAAEWVGTSRLEREGITGKTLRAGDRVRIWAAPNRNPTDTRIHLKRIRRSDGWQWGGGTAREER